MVGKVAVGRGQRFLKGQTYTMNVKMSLPDNQINEEEGMFMMCLSVSNRDEVLVDKSCRSSMVQYRSYLLRTLETVVFSPSLLFGFSSQKQELQVNFFNDFQGHPHTMAELLTFEIFSRHLQVSDVNIEVVAELKGKEHCTVSGTEGSNSCN